MKPRSIRRIVAMRLSPLRLLPLGLAFAFVQSAAAAPVLFCKDGPGIDLVNDGCISGEANPYPDGGDGVYEDAGGGDPEDKVEEAIFQATGTFVDIMLYGKSDDNPELFDGDINGETDGMWSVIDGTLIYYITIKAANSFALYELAPPSSTGVYSTLGILNNGGQQPTVSHISFWTVKKDPDPGTDIPEPATATLFSLAAVGMYARRRRLSA